MMRTAEKMSTTMAVDTTSNVPSDQVSSGRPFVIMVGPNVMVCATRKVGLSGSFTGSASRSSEGTERMIGGMR